MATCRQAASCAGRHRPSRCKHMGQGSARELRRSIELVGLATRIRCASSGRASRSVPTHRPSPISEMIATRPETLIVCTRDDTHADIIVAALEAGVDVITEKPMATTAEMCRRILDAEKRTGRRVDVTFNYRYSPTSRRIKELLLSGRDRRDRFGRLPLVSRYPARRRLFSPLACLSSQFRQPLRAQGDAPFRPVELVSRLRSEGDFARGELRHYGGSGPFRGPRCKTCPHADVCPTSISTSAATLARHALRGAVARGRLFPRRVRVPRGDRHTRHDECRDPL